MNIVVAMDSFKGSASAMEATKSIEKGIKKVIPKALVHTLPISDGGEGMTKALLSAMEGDLVSCKVKNPVGEDIWVEYAVLKDGTAVMEMAAASGLTLIDEDRRNPMYTSTFGTGQMIADAIYRGCRKIIMGLGGSATNDGGVGMATALGIKFTDSAGNPVAEGGRGLSDIFNIDKSGMNPRLTKTRIHIAVDVDNPLCGKNGAAYVFAEQKGANAEEIALLDEGLSNFAKMIKNITGQDFSNFSGAGAAGGTAVPLIAFCDAKISPGIELVLDALKIDEKIKTAHLVITGEGMIDGQSVRGKAPVGVAKRAKKYNKPVIALVGKIGQGYEEIYQNGIDSVFNIQNGPMDLSTSMENTDQLLQDCAQRVMRLYQIARN